MFFSIFEHHEIHQNMTISKRRNGGLPSATGAKHVPQEGTRGRNPSVTHGHAEKRSSKFQRHLEKNAGKYGIMGFGHQTSSNMVMQLTDSTVTY